MMTEDTGDPCYMGRKLKEEFCPTGLKINTEESISLYFSVMNSKIDNLKR